MAAPRLLRLLCVACLLSYCAAEVFTSIGHMAEKVFIEQDLLHSLKDYLIAEQNKLEQIKRWMQMTEEISKMATNNPEEYLGNPINAFHLVKRLNQGWSHLEQMVLQDTSEGFISNLTVQRQTFPTTEDQKGAAKALLRLQDTYMLSTKSMAKGDLPGVETPTLMSADDCFELGQDAYTAEDYTHTVSWMEEALHLLDNYNHSSTDKASILDYLSYSVYKQGDIPRALALTRNLIELDPNHVRATGNVRYYEFLVKQGKYNATKTNENEGNQHHSIGVERGRYEELCRGESISMTPRRQSRLVCRYQDKAHHPQLTLAPVKEEEEWDRPRILRYHDIISEKEMVKVKALANPRLRRATISNPITGELETAHYRVSKSAWLGAYEDSVVARINRRIEVVTGLNVETAEDLQVANYGMGGQYEPHFDFARKEEPDAFKSLGTGNRIATWLFYMSDVMSGGATVFTDIGAAIKPKKGTAVFWYNMFASGEGDYSTRHAACPVLVGNKWVSNKWIHERGQEFRRPCGLTQKE
uniref:prolyl 4-hydroxylase subunit alpha-1-like n=1 Tax=Myxine glutinosa TaxID=7769 RepID=UPI00358E1340